MPLFNLFGGGKEGASRNPLVVGAELLAKTLLLPFQTLGKIIEFTLKGIGLIIKSFSEIVAGSITLINHLSIIHQVFRFISFYVKLTKEFWTIIIEAGKKATSGIFEKIGEEISNIKKAFSPIGEAITEAFKPLAELFGLDMGGEKKPNLILEAVKLTAKTIGFALKIVGKVIESFVSAISLAIQGLALIIRVIVETILLPLTIAKSIKNFFGNMLGGKEKPQKKAKGGIVQGGETPKFASGGLFKGEGTSTGDKNLVLLSNNEYIVNARQTREHLPLLEAINQGEIEQPLERANGGLINDDPESFSLEMVEKQPMPSFVSPPLEYIPSTKESSSSKKQSVQMPDINFNITIEKIELTGESSAEKAKEFVDSLEPELQKKMMEMMQDFLDRMD